ncbi:MAG: MBL fold metallo-hydrolase [Gammaproteobacteria bacterium]|nr:MBL fold metallo-hydrolase [Gammaproteobacteria bacterium]
MTRIKQMPSIMAELEVKPGEVVRLSPLVRRLTARNPSAMTGPGTNSYLVGESSVAILDPGPADSDHLEALIAAAGDALRWIVLTHAHADHAAGAELLGEMTGIPIWASGIPLTGGHHSPFNCGRALVDGERIGEGFALQAVHTPGHSRDHLCYLLLEEGLLFSGDHIMQGSTVVIMPPDGDMGEYLISLNQLLELPLGAIAPGHGRVLGNPHKAIAQLIEHRCRREQMIIDYLSATGASTIGAMVAEIYREVPVELHPWAARSVHAHLLKLRREGRVSGMDEQQPWQLIAAGRR